jgi:hypothetical protein
MQDSSSGVRADLTNVTLCAASSVNVCATIHALRESMQHCEFANVKLFTDANIRLDHLNIEVIPVSRLSSAVAYSHFILSELCGYIETTHCLIVQWDGHVISGDRWHARFLEYDYLGARWPQFADGHDVGNGGFSLRSRNLMKLCLDRHFSAGHPEDVAIGRHNRAWLESEGLRFPPRDVADAFSAERCGKVSASFGFHGAWLLPQILGTETFWEVYCQLDDRTTIRHDFRTIFNHVLRGKHGIRRGLQLSLDMFASSRRNM